MFQFELKTNIFLGICASVCVISVLVVEGKVIHGYKKAKDQNYLRLNGTRENIHIAKRSIPTELTPRDPILFYVCEHNTKRVECEENTVIRVLKVNYGRTHLKTCDLDPEKKWSVKCVNNNKTKEVLMKQCNGKNTCDVQASNSIFGDPCRGTIKYLEVKYLCTPGNKPVTAHVCEHNNLQMKCDAGKVIQLLEANYGRTTLDKCSSYSSDWNLHCKSNNSEEIIKNKCDQKRSCEIEASNSVFGDPCRGTMKYVEMQYYCSLVENQANTDTARIPGIQHDISFTTHETYKAAPLVQVCEHNKKRLECQQNNVIHIRKAYYGRTSSKPCGVICVNNRTKEIVRKTCEGKRSCDLKASNSVFGDPCHGTIKYLEVKYLCKPGNKPITTHACEHKNLNLKCDTGKVIHILEANYGRKTMDKCPFWNLNCISHASENIIKQKCNQKRSCDIEARNSIFGDPCVGTHKYVEIDFYCAPKTTSLHVCEHNTKRLECQQNSVIHITEAYYGRRSLTPCSVICVHNKTKEIVRKTCEGKRSCEIKASNSVFGDPCHGTIKYLEVKYLCTPGNKSITTHACEHNNLNMKCDTGKVIHILEANYGRKIMAKCPYLDWGLNCKSHTSETIIKQKCNHKRSCDIEARNYIFGDPCVNTIKYVEIDFYCAPETISISEGTEVTPTPQTIPETLKENTTSDFNPTPTNFSHNHGTEPATISSSSETISTIPITESTILTTTSENPKTTTDYRETTSKIPHTLADTKTDYSEIITSMSPEEIDLNTLTNKISYSNTEFLPRVSPTPQAITVTVNKNPNFDFDQTPTNFSHNHGTEPATISSESTSTNPITETTILTTSSENPKINTDFTEINSEIPPTVFDTTTEDSELTKSPRESNFSTPAESISKRCGNYDLNCMKFNCSSSHGSHVHPNTRKMYIMCINWRPRVIPCGVGEMLSIKLMKCVSNDAWWGKWD
ncbi:hypothetical protein JTE90_016507 [Oedothorax gibbosus]|uniref:SUEL-type lectin domain-containing protein n=1 Tax=Oedothorax gibbosus TaxID=931172 RepID=A0AAV6U312_9ARAC|nr:hypothetical protein JTE90_016507 [Oedothorax gibbosus]